ncbi:hypothetical protein [Microvirga sp. 2TAF3]|uniref:hypothetical protein n=1 Tax=Microvirga sp. 2TAF3 TaxID=3233014 RepID=UPI003F9CE4C9
MTQSPPDTYDWYDEDDAFHSVNGTPSGVLPGLPQSLQNIGWWVSGIAFAALWIFESWSLTNPSFGKEGIGYMAESFWRLLLALAVCYGIFKFCKPRYQKLGRVLCIISAVVLLLQHMA